MTLPIVTIVVALATTAAILVRPWKVSESVWAVVGAIVCIAMGALSPARAWDAVRGGSDVYAFLVGILALSALAKRERLFDACAAAIVRVAGASQHRLFFWVFAGATAVTIVLSNDATIVVATPAVVAVLARTNVQPLPYLLICALVSNAASFVLPISNPANLVLFGASLPNAISWLAAFALPSIAALATTYALLYVAARRSLGEPLRPTTTGGPDADARFRLAGWLVCAGAAVLLAAAVAGADVGLAALFAALAVTFVFGLRYRDTFAALAAPRQYGIIVLVAGLFVIVAALDRVGALAFARSVTQSAAHASITGLLAYGAGIVLAANALNNLPVATALAATLNGIHDAHVQRIAVIAVDLGPNLSISGSLATLLWLGIVRREGIDVTALQFSRYGVLVTVPALLLAMLGALLR